MHLSAGTSVGRAATELVLIVAGILIALGVDGALADRRDRATALESLGLVRDDLSLLIDQVEEFRDYNRDLVQTTVRLERVLTADAPLPRTPEVWQAFVDIGGRRTLRVPRTAWEELVATGNPRLLGDAALRRDLVRFWETLARDEALIARNNAVFHDEMGARQMYGEGLVLPYPGLDRDQDIEVMRERSGVQMGAGLPSGPDYDGLVWRAAVDDPLRIRALGVTLAVSQSAAASSILADGVLRDATDLMQRVDAALAR